jgi:ATP-dependent Clp protease adaptor protein ClpS
MPNADIKTNVRARVDVKEPSMFRVIYLNDDKTAVDFVIASLVDHFAYNALDAEAVTLAIHEQGSAVVAVLPYEIAEQKGIEVTVSARSEGYPLQIKLEPAQE